jgi:hypothetical protein
MRWPGEKAGNEKAVVGHELGVVRGMGRAKPVASVRVKASHFTHDSRLFYYGTIFPPSSFPITVRENNHVKTCR